VGLDAGMKPFLEALRSLYLCKNPAASCYRSADCGLWAGAVLPDQVFTSLKGFAFPYQECELVSRQTRNRFVTRLRQRKESRPGRWGGDNAEKCA